ncbi:hypothetical protein HRR83_002352 [Exophiala dermatitidis]|uniref:Probable endonuclease LCL3 n=2 Tax=Exophiala dermatitidis TaxID=5970 RepID=H6BXN7_EXODN|nr:uncharacterized protein HMPREF1120_04642 [Exophiala dermatitidis NIH/UT8656]KAJ4520363.1 hypothetical protein HRR75_002228 [Exophiala dermatitidis]EHY56564.1 hypothetical protein HMPREF1120_04642 [Exophiala dermatitidis NIH/UT8656]KAJ4524232.1 hypothetical protein HRR74_002429 [Exophiala dermatitidis]KAJ4525495.1 hypothetical protein HRR73_002225 [Exophiala dermatitidis]KAJ4536812.1 hypothetical protein HRR76_004838 [Exophiala dermatitidis]
MALLQGRVKSILSGDTLVVANQKGAERTLSLAYISAPRLRREGDEPFAFQSREFLREQLLGKVVQFQILYAIPTTKREYGRVKLPDGGEFPDLVVQEGWAKVREDAGRKEDDENTLAYLDQLRSLEAEAKAKNKGLWGKGGQIESSSEVSDPNALVEQYKGRKVEAIVERVLTGDRLIARLMLTPTKHVQTMVVLAGVRAPATKRTSPEGKEIPAEPYGAEAHAFVDERLHQRKVLVELLGVTPQNQLIAHVLHPKGNIAKFLLEAGLARCNDQHVTLLGNEMAQFRQAENAAKTAKRGLFTGVSATKSAGVQDADFIVSRILNAETIFIRPRSGDERKVTLSSIRQPKPSDPKQAPFGADAKEFLRKRLIGKHVKVSIDGKRPASEGFEEREVATVTVNGKNVALALVEAGYASVIRHRRDDDDRSPDYDALLLAEETAQKEEKGMWSPKPPATKHYQDYSESLQKAKMEASVLQRQKKVPAIVDFVRTGSRFVLLVPRDNAKLTFVLSGVRTPKPARQPGDTAEPFGQEAYEFAYRRCMQRDVEIDVENTDKVGGFIGTMYVGRENFAKALVEEGLAEVHAYSAEQSGHANELFAAEQKAKEARKGMWHDWDPSKDQDEEAEVPAANGANGTNGETAETTSRRKDYRDVVVTNVDEAGKLKIQQVGPGTAALTELMGAFKSFHLNKANEQPLPGPPKVGDIVAAQFTADNEWYRARVRRVDREGKKVDVTYLDYGNSETLPWSRLRPLTQPQFSTQKLKPQATDAVLSFLQLPPSPQYLRDAVEFIAEQTEERQLVANVDYVAPEGTLYVTLLDPKVSTKIDESINAEIVREGLAMVPTKLKPWERQATETLAHLRELQDEAKKERRGMWEYGDLTED